jgi:hypothetical protein
VNYLKFAGFSLVAGIVFLCAGIFLDGYLGQGLALAITGAGFAFVKPAHFKFSYAVWIAASVISFLAEQWGGERAIRAAAESGSPYPGFASLNYDLGWLLGCALLNPVCYVLGKRLANYLLRAKKVSSLAEHFD